MPVQNAVEFALYIECDNPTELAGIVSDYFCGFSVETLKGYWDGNPENSCRVTVIVEKGSGFDWSRGEVYALAETLRVHYRQQEVWTTATNVYLQKTRGEN